VVLLSEQNHPWEVEERLVSPATVRDWESRCTAFEAISFWQMGSLTWRNGTETQRIPALRWSPGIFTILGMRLPLGRPFAPGEDQPGKDKVAVLSHEFWQADFGADPNVLGRTIELNNQLYTVIGVRPPDMGFLDLMGAVWIPLTSVTGRSGRGWSDVGMVARLKAGTSLARARLEIDTVAKSMAQVYRSDLQDWTVDVQPLLQWMNKLSRPAFFLHVPVALVLLIACTNAASLIIARGSARRRELSVRLALGASRGRIVRQLLTESLLYALPAGIAALGLIQGGVFLLLRLASPKLAWLIQRNGINLYVLVFAAAVSALTGLGCGLSPALLLTRESPSESLRVITGQGHERSRRRFLSSLVVLQIALSLSLLIPAGLLIRSFVRVQQLDMGFNPKNLLTIDTSLANPQSGLDHRNREIYRQILEEVQALPGVQSIALSSSLPWAHSGATSVRPVDAPEPTGRRREPPQIRPINPTYFSALGIPLLRGRCFTPQDDHETARTVVVNEALARLLFPGEDVIGRHLDILDQGMGVHEIVGVVGNIKQLAHVLKPQDGPTVYVPFSRRPVGQFSVVVRASRDPERLTRPLGEAIARAHPDLSVRQTGSVKDRMARTLSLNWPHVAATYMVVLSVVALLFASTGIYGIVAYAAEQRTHEIGIRLAMGARASQVLIMVMKRGLKLTLFGLLLGSLVAYVVAQIISGLLYETSPIDTLTLVSVYALLTAMALLACYLPSRKAARLDPMAALRCE
jgi:putative ABC transport system permease protein